jgi:transcriptional regulator with XRE-family HTH domain
MSQLELALASGISSRHVSFMETGRAKPSREMVHNLAERLDIPLRERNALLVAAGFAPAFPERDLAAPEMAAVREAVELVLTSHDPYPTIAFDRCGNVLMFNRGATVLAQALPPELLEPPVNVYRASLHPAGLPVVVENFEEHAPFILGRLERHAALTGDPELVALLEEVREYETVRGLNARLQSHDAVILAARFRLPSGRLDLFSTIATFGTPLEVTVSELAIEMFFPADARSTELLRELVGERS